MIYKHFQMPKELKQRMQDYFQTVWSLNHGIDIHEVRIFTLKDENNGVKFGLLTDSQRIPRRTSWRRQHASSSRNTSTTNLRGGIARMSKVAFTSHQNKLLCTRRVSYTQRRCTRLHLLHLQWIYGGDAEQYGCRHPW